jgi:hypothetical protein
MWLMLFEDDALITTSPALEPAGPPRSARIDLLRPVIHQTSQHTDAFVKRVDLRLFGL